MNHTLAIARTCRRHAQKRRLGHAGPYSITGTIPRHGQGVAVGQYAEVERSFSEHDILTYGQLVGDLNPLHQPWARGGEPEVVRTSPLVQWKEDSGDTTAVLAHGMLVASLFTCIFGTLIPGSIYLRQSLDFRKPVYAGDVVRGRVTISSIRQWKRRGLVLTCNTTVRGARDVEHIRGQADVWLVNGKTKETNDT